MRKRFKSKKSIKYKKILWLIFILLGFFFSYIFLYYKFSNALSLEEYLNTLLKTSFNYQVSSDILNNTNILNITTNNFNNESNGTSNSPLIYIYNTHDEEEYYSSYNSVYNINPNVKMATLYLQEKLNNLDINTIVEKRSIKTILNNNNWIYKYSYKASRIYLEDTYKNNPSLKYFIDLHRDSSIKEKTTTTIDNKNYARVLFIVGLEHENYDKNLEVTKRLNDLIIKYYPSLSRGIYKKSGAGVNGIYNQDFNPNTVLIELGGQYNTIEEVSNTIDLLAPIIKEFINE